MLAVMRDSWVAVVIVAMGCRHEPPPVQPQRPLPSVDAAVAEPPISTDAEVVAIDPPRPPQTVIRRSTAAPRSCDSPAIAAELARGERALAAAIAKERLVRIDPVELPHELNVRPGPTPRDPPEWADSDARFAVRDKLNGDVVDYRYRGKPHRGVFVAAPRWVLVTRGSDSYLAIPSSILEVPCTSKQMVRACGSSFSPSQIIAIPAGTTFRGVLPLTWEHVRTTLVGGPTAACPA